MCKPMAFPQVEFLHLGACSQLWTTPCGGSLCLWHACISVARPALDRVFPFLCSLMRYNLCWFNSSQIAICQLCFCESPSRSFTAFSWTGRNSGIGLEQGRYSQWRSHGKIASNSWWCHLLAASMAEVFSLAFILLHSWEILWEPCWSRWLWNWLKSCFDICAVWRIYLCHDTWSWGATGCVEPSQPGTSFLLLQPRAQIRATKDFHPKGAVISFFVKIQENLSIGPESEKC